MSLDGHNNYTCLPVYYPFLFYMGFHTEGCTFFYLKQLKFLRICPSLLEANAGSLAVAVCVLIMMNNVMAANAIYVIDISHHDPCDEHGYMNH